jgi:hypothetical protein
MKANKMARAKERKAKRVARAENRKAKQWLNLVYHIFIVLNATNSFYNSTNNDNNDFWIDYPVNNNITLTLNTFAGTAMANMPHYTLMLNLIGVEDQDILTNEHPNHLSSNLRFSER